MALKKNLISIGGSENDKRKSNPYNITPPPPACTVDTIQDESNVKFGPLQYAVEIKIRVGGSL